MLGSACWLPSCQKGNHKNTESGKNDSMLLGHLHQTHRESKVPTQENRQQHYFLITIFWWLVCLQVSQTCLFTPALSAICQRNCQIILTPTAGSLSPEHERGFALWRGSHLQSPCGEAAQLLWQSPAAPPLCSGGMWGSQLKCTFLIPFMSLCICISRQEHFPFFHFTLQ